MELRAIAPLWLKSRVWNHKARHVTTNLEGSPADLIDVLTEEVSPNATLLDLGCGAGHLLAGLRRKGWAGHYVGMDISEKAIATAKQLKDSKSEWLVGPVEQLPAIAADVITFTESLYYVPITHVNSLLEKCRILCSGPIYSRIWHLDRHAAYVRKLADFNQGNLRCVRSCIYVI